jgi:hypothetical protein
MSSSANLFRGESTRAPQNVHYTRGLEGSNQALLPPYIRTTFLFDLEPLSLGLVWPGDNPGPPSVRQFTDCHNLYFRQYH